MELKAAIESRASVRQFLPDAIDVNHIKEMVRLASLAPSVNNYQPWQFIAITNKEFLTKMATEVRGKILALPDNDSRFSANVKNQVEFFATFFEQAPALIAICLESYETVLEKGVTLSHDEINQMRNSPDLQSTGACIQNLLLAAVDMGYGACWMSAPMVASNKLEEMLNINTSTKLISFVAVGRPLKPVKPREKKPIEDIFREIK
jgi:nitroreductase